MSRHLYGYFCIWGYSLCKFYIQTVIGINWDSYSGEFDIAIYQLNLNSINTESQWELQRQAIEKFKLKCQDDEKLKFEQALSYIPTYAFMQ
jgi:hypothetical protein